MSKENNFTRGIATNLAEGDKSYARNIQCWQLNIEYAVRAALNAGFLVGVNDGEVTTVKHSADFDTIMDALWTTDEDYLLFYKIGSDAHFGWIWLVYGNGPDEVISDYSTILGPLFMDDVNAYADKLF